jgi:hypothetical protein
LWDGFEAGKDKQVKYRIKLAVVDKEFADRFEASLKLLGQSPSRAIRKPYKETWHPVHEVVLNNRDFIKKMAPVVGTFALPPKKGELVEMFRGVFDSDASVITSKNRKRCIVCIFVQKERKQKIIRKVCDALLLKVHESFIERKERGKDESGIRFTFKTREIHDVLGKFTIGRKEAKFEEYEKHTGEAGTGPTELEIEHMKKHRPNSSYAKLSREMGRSKFTIKKWCQDLGLRRKNYERLKVLI